MGFEATIITTFITLVSIFFLPTKQLGLSFSITSLTMSFPLFCVFENLEFLNPIAAVCHISVISVIADMEKAVAKDKVVEKMLKEVVEVKKSF